MRIAIYGRLFGDDFTADIKGLFSRLAGVKAEITVFEPFYEFLRTKMDLSGEVNVFNDHLEIRNKTDYVFSIGGDGTFLEAAYLVRDSEIPIMGINTGRMGFLSSIGTDEIEKTIDAIVQKAFKIDSRDLLKLETDDGLFGEKNFALNELTVHKKDSASMVIVHAYLDGEFLNSYWADGLIVSTPSGSTAYSLSCGGPIIVPGSGNFVINPVAPHNLNVRPLVVPANSTITLRVEGRSDSFLVSLDSRSETIEASTELRITRNNFKINLLRLEDYSYLNTIRGKLNWGMDRRN